MRLHLPSAIIGAPQYDETALMLSWVVHQQRVTLRRTQRQVVIGGGLCCAGLTLLVLTISSIAYKYDIEYWVGLCIGAVAFICGVGLIVAEWIRYPGRPVDFVKAYWRIIALPCTKGGFLLWNTLETNPKTISLFKVDSDHLRQLASQIDGACASLDQERHFVGQLQTLDHIIGAIQFSLHHFAPISRSSQHSHQLVKLFPYLQPLPKTIASATPVLRGEDDWITDLLVSWNSELQSFVISDYGQVLEGVREQVMHQCDLARHALARAREIGKMTNDASQDVHSWPTVLRSATGVFDPVVQALQKEIEPDERQKKSEYEISLLQHQLEYRMMSQNQGHEQKRLIQIADRSVDECEREAVEAKDDLQSAREEIGYDSYGNQKNPLAELQHVDAKIKVLQTPSPVHKDTAFELSSTDSIEHHPSSDLGRLRSKRRQLQQQIGQLKRAEDRNKKASDALRQAYRDREMIQVEQAEESLHYQNELASMERTLNQLMGEQLDKLRKHITSIQADHEHIKALIERDTVSANEQQAISKQHIHGMNEELFELRDTAIRVQMESVESKLNALLKQLHAIQAAVEADSIEVQALPTLPQEILIPVWFAHYEHPNKWLPFAGPCKASIRTDEPRDDMSITLDYEETDQLFAYLCAQIELLPPEALEQKLTNYSALGDLSDQVRVAHALATMQENQLISEGLYRAVLSSMPQIR